MPDKPRSFNCSRGSYSESPEIHYAKSGDVHIAYRMRARHPNGLQLWRCLAVIRERLSELRNLWHCLRPNYGRVELEIDFKIDFRFGVGNRCDLVSFLGRQRTGGSIAQFIEKPCLVRGPRCVGGRRRTWSYLTYDKARAKAYRWGEDGIAGLCDRYQLLQVSAGGVSVL